MATAYDRKANRPRLDSLRSNTSSTVGGGGFNRPPSPSFSQTTSGSLAGTNAPHVIINRSDLRDSLSAYENLMDAGKAYRRALLEKSTATAHLASAMEACCRLKGSDASSSGLLATAGFHYVVSNSEQVLADTFYKNFEIPLLHSLDSYRQDTVDRQASYEQSLVDKTKVIRQIEAEQIKTSKKKGKGRDLNSFRKTLELLQAHVHELDQIKMEYHSEVLDAEDEIWETILNKIGMVVKTQLEVYDRITTKANDLSLEPLLAANPDPFEAYAQPDQDASTLFSILPPIGILPTTSSSSQNLRSSHSSPRIPSNSTSNSTSNNSQPSSQPTTPKASTSSLPQSPSSDGFLSPRKVDASLPEDDLTPRKSAFGLSGGSILPHSESFEGKGGPRKTLSVIGETNGARSRESSQSSSAAGDGDDAGSIGGSTVGRASAKSRGSIPFPATPSQDSLRFGGGLMSGGDEEVESVGEGAVEEEGAPTNDEEVPTQA